MTNKSIKWFCTNNFITKLLDLFLDTEISIDKVESAARIIDEIVQWKQSHQNGVLINTFADYFNTDKHLEKFICVVFETENKNVREHGLSIISDMLACNTSKSELCKMPLCGLPAIYKYLVNHFERIKSLLQSSQSTESKQSEREIVGQTRIKLSFIVFSLLLSNLRLLSRSAFLLSRQALHLTG